jgi:membrane-associated protease RseP (regulator of RpoE activity)
MINLLPIGQLDGGHIATAYFGNRYNRVAARLHLLLPVGAVGVFAWAMHLLRSEGTGWDDKIVYSIAVGAAMPWLVWFILVKVLRRASGGVNHPPVDEAPLPKSRRVLFWVMVAVFVSVFMPIPFRTTLVGSPPPEPPETALAE